MASPNIKNAYLPSQRKHVTQGSQWGHTAGTDFWLLFNPGVDLMATATAGTIVDELVDGGWTATSMANTAGSAGDFAGGVRTPISTFGPIENGASFADAGTPNHALTNASGDILISPAIFGDAAHMEMAATLLGKRTLPRYLIASFWAAFTVASADEVTSVIGFFEDGATASTEADQYAVIYSNGTNFKLNGNAANMSTGAVVDNVWRKWDIVLEFNGATGPNCYWYMNGTRQSSTAGVGLQDEFPLKFGLHSLTTNRQGLGPTHVYYDY